MNKQKTAILVDSGTDVPQPVREKYPIYVLPLKVIYPEREYLSGVDIQSKTIYERMRKGEIPKTSLPTMYETQMFLEHIQQDGYEKVIVISLSSSLSGTYNMLRLVAQETDQMEIAVIDSKSVSTGAGFLALRAGELLEQGLSFSEIIPLLEASVLDNNVFFCLPTLEYLYKGGRIGLVQSLLGNVLGIKPVISCNSEGAYYIVDKKRGWKRTIQRTEELAAAFAIKGASYNICFVHGQWNEEAKEVNTHLRAIFGRAGHFFDQEASPALVVHTGPEIIGIAIQRCH